MVFTGQSLLAYAKATVLLGLSITLFFAPFLTLLSYLNEPALQSGDIPSFASDWHHNLTERIEPWARERIASRQAMGLNINNISGTEWPIFTAVYYLWATEALQEAWLKNPTLAPTMPTEYANEAIEAAAALVADPNHAAWVQQHWGDDYLQQENIFYRMLLISGLTSYQKLSGRNKYQALLSNQVEMLGEELDASPHGLLDDYPGQCYPIDILPAIAAIQRADRLLGKSRLGFVERSLRGFSGNRLDPATQLPAYIAHSRSGVGIGPARGVGISYMLIWAPELWPEVASNWYGHYETHFWQAETAVSGVREFAKAASQPEWAFEVDAGPVLAGYGTAASAFGIGAGRVNGRFDHAYPLSLEALVATWPLPNGTLLGPRLLSNLSDAPFIGEAILLFNFTRQLIIPPTPEASAAQTSWPLVVYFGLAFYLIGGLAGLGMAAKAIKQASASAAQ
ncbi:MAG: hypothetical protein AAF614_24645 [Chloroflexota bacterium]